MSFPFTKPNAGLNGFFRDINNEDVQRVVGELLNFQYGLQSIPYVAGFATTGLTPDYGTATNGGRTIAVTLTGNVNINNPVNDPLAGSEVVFIWTQDATGGRTMNYTGSKFKTNGNTAAVTTLSTVTIDKFVFDGLAYRLVARSTAQTI